LGGFRSECKQTVKHLIHPLSGEGGHRRAAIDPLYIRLVYDRHERYIDSPADLFKEANLVIERVAAVFTCVKHEQDDVGRVYDGTHCLPLDRVPLLGGALQETRSIDELNPFAASNITVTDDDPFCGERIGGDLRFRG